ncbi:MAG: hypothetical protein KBF17_15360 [Candidatus Promineofilum sp.]|nr:hypothetical protein [Promineifilum sp.]
MPTDLYSPIHKRIPLAQAQGGIETYIDHMSAGKILLVAARERSRSTGPQTGQVRSVWRMGLDEESSVLGSVDPYSPFLIYNTFYVQE